MNVMYSLLVVGLLSAQPAMSIEQPVSWQIVKQQTDKTFDVNCRYKATLFQGTRVLYAISASAHYVDFELDGVRASVPAASPDQLFVSDGKVINAVLFQRCDD